MDPVGSQKTMINHQVVVGSFQCNCRILACPVTGEALVIDPGGEPQKILSTLGSLKTTTGAPLRVKYLMHTHAHLDHIGATREVREALVESPRIALHGDDEDLYLALKMQGQLFGVDYEDPLPIDHRLEDGEEFKLGTLKFSILHTPGHSPGGVCVRLHEGSDSGARETLFTGDTLFQGSIGRTDLWGGDMDTLMGSIRKRIFALDGDTTVCPGHGPQTTIAIEKRQNPFLK